MSEYFGYGIIGFGGGVRPNYLLEYAVQAGGGGGGSRHSPGAGGGGLRYSTTKTLKVYGGDSHAVTVGSGGVANYTNTGAMSNPSGFSTYPASFGGMSHSPQTLTPNEGFGGCGEGGNEGNRGGYTPAEGTDAGQGGSPTPEHRSPGGGGTENVGYGQSGGHVGGQGRSLTITGSGVNYGGGGGGAGHNSGNAGNGQGGGSTANRGGGGGAGGHNTTGQSGGSGVVILRRETAKSTTTSGQAATDGADTIHTFNTTGTYNA